MQPLTALLQSADMGNSEVGHNALGKPMRLAPSIALAACMILNAGRYAALINQMQRQVLPTAAWPVLFILETMPEY